jgi:hypothetical protein
MSTNHGLIGSIFHGGFLGTTVAKFVVKVAEDAAALAKKVAKVSLAAVGMTGAIYLGSRALKSSGQKA